MVWIISISIWLLSFIVHLMILWIEDRRIIFRVGDIIDEIEFYMWFPMLNTVALIALFVGFVVFSIIKLLQLDILWEKFRNIKLK